MSGANAFIATTKDFALGLLKSCARKRLLPKAT